MKWWELITGFLNILEDAIEKFIKTLQAEGKPATEVEIDQFYGICYFSLFALLLVMFSKSLFLYYFILIMCALVKEM